MLCARATPPTAVLQQLHEGAARDTEPTMEFNVEDVRVGSLTMHMWDVGGQDALRPYWRHHFTGTQGVVYVVDSADRARLQLARTELATLLADDQLAVRAVLRACCALGALPDARCARRTPPCWCWPTSRTWTAPCPWRRWPSSSTSLSESRPPRANARTAGR